MNLRHSALLRFMTPEFRASIVGDVLDHKSDLPSDVRRKLDLVIKAVVRVPRFPNQPERAPTPVLRQPVIERLLDSEPLVNAIFESWFVSKQTLYAIVRSHLFTRDIEAEYPDFNSYEFRGAWSYDTWMSTRDDILSSHDELPIDDVALMLCFAADRLPSDPPADSRGDNEYLEDSILDQARRYLELLPADAPEWFEDVPYFVTAVSEIAEKKEVERESVAAVRALNSQLTELDQYRDKLNYLELDTSSWRASTGVPVVNVEEAFGLLRELTDALQEYDPEPRRGSSLSETQRLRKEHDAATESIQELKGKVDHLMGPQPECKGENPALGPDETGGGETEPGTAEPLSDIKVSEGTLEFDPSQSCYFLKVENDVEQLTVMLLANHDDAAIKVTFVTPDGETVRASELGEGEFLVSPVQVGETIIRMTSTFGEEDDRQIYILSVTREQSAVSLPSADATLKRLWVSAGDIDFDPELTHHSFDLNGGLDGFTLKLEPTHEAASICVAAEPYVGGTDEVEGSSDREYFIATHLKTEGDISLLVSVTAEDKETTQNYTVVAKRGTRPDPTEHLWNLVAQDDLAGAYWLARAIESQGDAPPVLPQLLKAVQGARWLSPNSDAFVEDLSYIVNELDISDYEDTHVLLRLAAGLVPSLVAPGTNLLAWLAAPACLPRLDAIISPVKAYASRGLALHSEYIHGDEGNQELQGLIAQASAEARQWLEEAPQKQQKFPRARNIWHYLCRDGLLIEMLTPVSEDDRGKMSAVQDCIDRLNQVGHAELINLAEDSMGARYAKSAPIVGNARGWLMNGIEEAKIRADKWLSLLLREAEGQSASANDWRLEQVSTLRAQVQAELSQTLDGLSELSSEGDSPALSAAAKCVTRSMQQLADYLKLEVEQETPLPTFQIIYDLGVISSATATPVTSTSNPSQLDAAISRRLLWAPSVDLDDGGLLRSDESLKGLTTSPADFDLVSMTLEQVMLRRMDCHDFRFFGILSHGLSSDATSELSKKFQSELGAERKALREELQATQAAVEQAEKDGVVEFEGSLWSRHKNTMDDVNVDEVLDFGMAYDDLDSIKHELDKEREKRCQELLDEWEELESRFHLQNDGDQNFPDEAKETFEIASRPQSLDIRVMEECVSRLRNHQSGEEEYPTGTMWEEAQPGTLEEFQEFYRSIGDPKAHATDSEGIRNLIQELNSKD